MKFGVRLPNSGPFASVSALTTMTRTAEDLGFDAVSVHDHVNWGDEDKYHFYTGTVEAADAAAEPFDFFDALPTMAYLAAITERVRIIPAALCLGWRHPLVVARAASTLYALSSGRFVLGVCPGNVTRDFEMLGASWDRRGRTTEETLQVLRRLVDDPSDLRFNGTVAEFDGARIRPHPAGLKIWYGGTSAVAMRRVAQYCDGWMPAGGPGYFRESAPRIRALAEKHGRADADIEMAMITRMYLAHDEGQARAAAQATLDYQYKAEWLKRHDLQDLESSWLVGPPEMAAAKISEASRAGVDLMLHTVMGGSVSEVTDQLHMFAEQVMPIVEPDGRG